MPSCSTPLGKRKDADVLPCQVIEKSYPFKGMVDITETFSTIPKQSNQVLMIIISFGSNPDKSILIVRRALFQSSQQ